MSKRPIDPFADQLTCAKCKFRVDLPPTEASADGRVDYSLYICTQAAEHLLCYDNRQAGAACGPDGKLWAAKA